MYFEIFCAIVALVLSAYYYLKSNYDFWSSRGVPGPKPILFFGNFKDFLLGRNSLFNYLQNEYQNYKHEPMFGVFDRRSPILVVNDPQLIKDILIKDFPIFADRGIHLNNRVEPLSQHLFSLEPERWRPIRPKLSPIFTSGKLKKMFYLLSECADYLEQFLDKHIEKHSIVEIREISAKYTTDVIGACAFGLKMNSIGEEDSEFRKFGRAIFEMPVSKFIKLKIKESLPWLYNLLGPIFYEYKQNRFFINIMKNTMEYRKKNNIKRGDFIDLLMEIKDSTVKPNDIEMTDILIAAQAFVFFVAGFETSASTMSNTLYELAINQQIQDKLRQEVIDQLEKDNGELKYESVNSMKYMKKVVSETLRKYPIVPMMRKSTTSYTFSGTKVTIPKGTDIWIPAYAIQRDPEIYPDPEKFDPERFSEENVRTRHPSFHLPFGDGPRNCIGARFAVFQTYTGLVKIVKNYQIDICDKTPFPYEISPRAFLLTPKDGIHLKFTKIS